MANTAEKIEIESITTPGKVYRVDKVKYTAMREALVKVFSNKMPGLTVAEAQEKLIPLLPQDLFPNGEKSGWWLKSVQLDLEAKEIIQRDPTKPMRLYKL